MNTLHIKGRWEIEMNLEISLDMWGEICTKVYFVISLNIWQEYKRKVIMRFFCTPEAVAKFGMTHSGKCQRNCSTQTGKPHLFIYGC